MLDEMGITYPQYLVLNVLGEEDGRTIGAIAARLALESSTITPLVKRMEAAGLVERQRSPDNEREVQVRLTEAGRKLFARSRCLGESLLQRSGLTLPQLDALNRQILDLTAALDAGEHDGARRRGSIETLVHVAVQAVQPVPYVAHTHPTAVLGLLASIHAESAFAQWVYSDEAVVIGVPLFVPYAEPGIALGRVFLDRLRAYHAERGELPSVVLLANHGIVAIGGSPEAVEAITLMTVKGARTRVQALSIGGVTGLGEDAVSHYFERTDMA